MMLVSFVWSHPEETISSRRFQNTEETDVLKRSAEKNCIETQDHHDPKMNFSYQNEIDVNWKFYDREIRYRHVSDKSIGESRDGSLDFGTD